MQFSKHSGYSLIEWMVSMAIGLFLIGGISTLFIAGQRTTEVTFQFGEMQEQGRFALELLGRDIRHAGFYGDYTGNLMKAGSSITTLTQPTKQCFDDKSLPTFPTITGEYRSIWAMQVSGSGTVSDMGCILDSDPKTDLVADSMVLSIKRVQGEAVDCAPASINSSRYYLASNSSTAEIVTGASVYSGCSGLMSRIANMRLWEFQHHVYYLDRLTNTDGTITPQLRQMELKVHGSGDGMYLDSGAMVQGVEDLQLMFGVDLTGDGQVNHFLPLSEINDGDWDQQRIVAVQLFLLIRARSLGKAPYKNTATYQLGDRFVTVDDRYRRVLLSEIIPLRNQILINAG